MDTKITREIISSQSYEKLIRTWAKGNYLIDIEYPDHYAGSYVYSTGYGVFCKATNINGAFSLVRY